MGSELATLALIGRQPAFFEAEDGFQETPYYDGEKLQPRMRITGPAIVLLPDTNIIVFRDCALETEENSYHVLEAAV